MADRRDERRHDRQVDRRLVNRCKRGEEAAFAELLTRYRQPVYGLCLRMVRDREQARDLAQEVFIKVFSLLDRYDEQYAFASWLFRIASNHCIDYLRRNRLRFISLDGLTGPDGEEREMPVPDRAPLPDSRLEGREAVDAVEAVVAELPPHYRLMIQLRHGEGLAYEEIAQVLDMPLGTVKARIHRARALIRSLLREKGYEIA